MAGKQARITRSVQVGVGVSLTAVAGFVDAVGYIELGGFFASFMSGASISLGVGARAAGRLYSTGAFLSRLSWRRRPLQA